MAIRYDKEYNAEIRRTVKNFNQLVNRALKRGAPQNTLPQPIKVSTLKSLYTTRKELNQQLSQIKKFSSKNLSTYVTLDSGAKFNKWKYDYLKLNADQAKEYFEARKDMLSKRISRGFAGETMRLDNVVSKLETLNQDPQTMSESQYRSYEAAINEYMNAPARAKAGYRGFLSEVDEVMKRVQLPDNEINEFFKKFKTLTPDQFQYLYDNSDLIGRVYDIIDSPIHGNKMKMNTSKSDATTLVNMLMEEVDGLVTEAQEKA